MIKRIKGAINVLLGRSFAVRKTKSVEVEKKKFCSVCENNVQKFERLPDYYIQKLDEAGYIHPHLGETMNILGYSCPVCGAADRDRLYALFMNKSKHIHNNSDFKFLDIAPSMALQKFIKKNYPKINYRSADLMMENVDDKVDLTNMQLYENDRFNFLICSHVLEHVVNDTLAIKELYRVLKPGGSGIVMVPILLTLTEDYENQDAQTPIERWKHYGQDDHVRMYSKPGFIKKLENTGFVVNQYGMDYFSEELFAKNGIHSRSVLYIVEK